MRERPRDPRCQAHFPDPGPAPLADTLLDPPRALLRAMSDFAPEMSLAEVIGRVRRTLKSALGATYAHVLLYDASAGELVLLPVDGPAGSVAGAAAALEKLGGVAGQNGLRRISAARCGALYEAITTADVVCVADIAADAGRPDWLAAQDLLDAALCLIVETSSLVAAPVILESTGEVAAVILVTNKRSLRPESPSASSATPAHRHTRSLSSEAAYAAAALTGVDDDDAALGEDSYAQDGEWSEDAEAAGHASFIGGGGGAEGSSALHRTTGHLSSMRRWTMSRASTAVSARPSSAAAARHSMTAAASARLGFAATASGGIGGRRSSGGASGPGSLSASASGALESAARGGTGSRTPLRVTRAAAAAFSERDSRVVVGVAAALALALEDRGLEFETLVGALEYTLLAAVRDPVRVFVDTVSGVPMPGRRRRRNSSEVRSPRSPAAAGGGGSASAAGASPRAVRPRIVAGSVVCEMLLVHGSEVLSTTTSSAAQLVR